MTTDEAPFPPADSQRLTIRTDVPKSLLADDPEEAKKVLKRLVERIVDRMVDAWEDPAK